MPPIRSLRSRSAARYGSSAARIATKSIPSRVEVIETHFSWVFLTDSQAYKLKKPVQGVGFDFRSIAARRRNAMAEVRLNRRLAPDVYLGAVPLVLRADGGLSIGGPGRPVDWLVKMIRLEADHMFDRRIARRDWHYAEIEALAHRLATFFATARAARLTAPQLKTPASQPNCATRSRHFGRPARRGSRRH